MGRSIDRVTLVLVSISAALSLARGEVTKARQDSAGGVVTITKLKLEAEASLNVPYEGSRPEVRSDFPAGFFPAVGSGLAFRGKVADGGFELWVVTDRGPNGDGPTAPAAAGSNETGAGKVFPAPSFAPSVGVVTVARGHAVLKSMQPLTRGD